MTKNYLLEIGTEKLSPELARVLPMRIKAEIELAFESVRLPFSECQIWGAFRRFVIFVKGLPMKQEAFVETVKGPAKNLALDDEGNPTAALTGFMKSQGIVDISSICYREFKGEDYACVEFQREGRVVEVILQELLPSLLKDIALQLETETFDWMLSILDDQVLPLAWDGISVFDQTRGVLPASSILSVESTEKYVELLRKNGVLVIPEERRDVIKYGSEKAARAKGGNVEIDPELLHELTFSVEFPRPIIGRIPEAYLLLPEELVTAVLKEKRSVFSVWDEKRRLLSYFVGVAEHQEDEGSFIQREELELEADLKEVRTLFDEDRQASLSTYVEKLREMVFHEKLGSWYDKTRRLVELSKKLAKMLVVGEETELNVIRAAELSKADLATKIIEAFPALRGKMGMRYAESSGENGIVGKAIAEQYLPLFEGEGIPETTAGAILSLADKLDTICGLFAVNILRAEAEDSFAISEGALGIFRILLERKLNLSVDEMVDSVLYVYVNVSGLVLDYESVKTEISCFFDEHVKLLLGRRKIRPDVIDAVSTRKDAISNIDQKASLLSRWMKRADFVDIISAFHRVKSLVGKNHYSEVQPELFAPEDRELWASYSEMRARVEAALLASEYDGALESLFLLKDPIDNYLDHVMVMVDNESVRNNRLAILKHIEHLMMKTCNLSKLVME